MVGAILVLLHGRVELSKCWRSLYGDGMWLDCVGSAFDCGISMGWLALVSGHEIWVGACFGFWSWETVGGLLVSGHGIWAGFNGAVGSLN